MLLNEKQSSPAQKYHTLPLTSRPLDLLYYSFFLLHTVTTLLFDCQWIYPSHLIPDPLKQFAQFYISISRDPLLGGLDGAFKDTSYVGIAWFRTFVWMELLFQTPIFILGMSGLKKGSQSIYPLLLLYSASSATTTLACIFTILAAPTSTAESIANNLVSLSNAERLVLLSSYVPFFLVPFGMAVDMTMRLTKLVKKAVRDEKWE